MLLDSNIVIYAAEPNYDAVREFIGKHSPLVSVISNQFDDDANAVEAVRRWENGVRIKTPESYHRINLPDKGWTIVYKNTSRKIDSYDIRLSSD